MVSENNHYINYWDDKLYYFPHRKNYKVVFGKPSIAVTFKDAVINTATNISNNYQNINLFLSGGFDSNVALLGFIYAKKQENLNIKILRYENDINIFDYSISKKLCEMYKLKYEIIDINIKNFLKKECLFYCSKILTRDPYFGLLIKLLEKYVDPSYVNIFGIGDFEFKFSQKDTKFYVKEREYLGRLNIQYCNYIPFYRYDPNIMSAWLLDQRIIDFTKNKTNTTNWNEYKTIFYRYHFPELPDRKKHTGFELVHTLFYDFESQTKNYVDKYNIDKSYSREDYLYLLS